jgi:dolichol-phosphate mannosyltransferase
MNDIPLQISIPVYNESDNITGVLEEIAAKVSVPYRINVIYDFDEDTTIPVVNKFITDRKAQNIFLVKNVYSKGVLNAIKTGFETASDGAVLVVMADSSDDLAVVNSMYERINQGYDIVCGSRYMKGGKQIGGPRIKGFLSRTAGMSLHLITGIPTHDPTNSFKMYRKSVLKDLTIESDGGFEIGIEIVVKSFLNGHKITEVPSIWRDRTAGESRFKLRKWLPKYIHWYLYAFKARFRIG